MVAQMMDATLSPTQPSGCPPAGAGAVIIGGDYRGLGIVRSLGRRGIPVWVLTDDHTLAATSRYVQRRFRWPGTNEADQIAFLLGLQQDNQLNQWLLFPTGDETAALIARHHAELAERFWLTTPSWEVLQWAYDKRLTYQLAAQLGLDHPWTCCPSDREQLVTLVCDFPIILKPAIKAGFNRFVHDKAWRIDDHSALLARYEEACALVDPAVIMVQELIPGGGDAQFSYAALCVDGQPLASLVARRLRQYPPDFGRSSSYVESIVCPQIEESAQRLLAALSFTGLVEVEFKYDARSGQYKLLDINPRIWGWHTLGQRAGVDFSYSLWQLMHGASLTRLRGEAGVRWIRMATDLPTIWREIRQHRLSWREYLRSLRGPLEFAIFAADDPLPALMQVPLASYLAWKRGAA